MTVVKTCRRGIIIITIITIIIIIIIIIMMMLMMMMMMIINKEGDKLNANLLGLQRRQLRIGFFCGIH